jgi:hypothetical protein
VPVEKLKPANNKEVKMKAHIGRWFFNLMVKWGVIADDETSARLSAVDIELKRMGL